ncbi:spore germination protein GerW family protein [Microterricola viridarii]|uniref:Sporulation protein YtfJ (Spore_YtfJ) n=1 Tax=Microterricola viridarii TaxID=412690 RepID=A0A0Y0NAS7_9MICO|nr:spore germination protein GerW family protein [Microterricola viridarii]AMB58221.1 hypothetical protein AWU67_04430 [Microterricola viridarii]
MSNIAVQLAESVRNAGASTVYGDPVEVDGQEMVPVALAWYGFGGGGGEMQSKNAVAPGAGDEAGGGGGGGVSIPIGAYIKRDGVLRFEPNVIALLAVATPFVGVLGWAVSRFIKVLKH